MPDCDSPLIMCCTKSLNALKVLPCGTHGIFKNWSFHEDYNFQLSFCFLIYLHILEVLDHFHNYPARACEEIINPLKRTDCVGRDVE